MAYKLLFIAKRERVRGSWVFAEGQALNPIPNLVFQNFYEQPRRKRRGIRPLSASGGLVRRRRIKHSDCLTVGLTKMKGIWQEFKVRLLIWIFYGAYWLIKSIKIFQSSEIQTNESDDCHSTQSCG